MLFHLLNTLALVTTILSNPTAGVVTQSDLTLSLYTGADCAADPGTNPGVTEIMPVYGTNNPYQIRSYNKSRALLPNEVLDFSNYDNNESGAQLHMGMTGNMQACSAYMASAMGFDRGAGCTTVASPWLFFGCARLWITDGATG